MNRLLKTVGGNNNLNSDEAYDPGQNNGGQPYRLCLKNYNKDSKYLRRLLMRSGPDYIQRMCGKP